jgi:hypothetical protein
VANSVGQLNNASRVLSKAIQPQKSLGLTRCALLSYQCQMHCALCMLALVHAGVGCQQGNGGPDATHKYPSLLRVLQDAGSVPLRPVL